MNSNKIYGAGLVLSIMLLAGCNDEKGFNSPPLIAANSFVTETDVAINDRVVATDIDGDSLTFALNNQPGNGSVTLAADGSFSYTPEREFTGNDSFSVTVNDGSSTVGGLVNITVNVATVSFLVYSRAAFAQNANQTALSVNGRNFTQDATSEADYADLISDQ